MDSQLHCFSRISVPHDTMEGMSGKMRKSSAYHTDWPQSKLSVDPSASPFAGGNKSKLKLGLFSYPVLQAADILVHRYVPRRHSQGMELMTTEQHMSLLAKIKASISSSLVNVQLTSMPLMDLS